MKKCLPLAFLLCALGAAAQPAVIDLLGGTIQLGFVNISAGLQPG